MNDVIDTTAITVSEAPMTLYGTDNPTDIIERATKQATALADVIKQRHLYADIQGKQHVLIEGWTLLGSLVGVYAVPVWTKPVEGGWEARVEARTMSGAVVGAAEAECLRDEKQWASRDDYALRSMAQTRASAKALRLPLGFIMQLAGFDPTPADEMPREDSARQGPRPIPVNGRSQMGNPNGPATDNQVRAVSNMLNQLERDNPAAHTAIEQQIVDSYPALLEGPDDGPPLAFDRLSKGEASVVIDLLNEAMGRAKR